MPPKGSKSLKRKAVKTNSPMIPYQREESDLLPEVGKKAKLHIQPQVLAYIRSANEPVSVEDIAQALDVPPRSVQHAALKLSKSVPQVKVLTRGQLWQWAPLSSAEAQPTEAKLKPQPKQPDEQKTKPKTEDLRTWYEVGNDGDGNPLVRKYGDTEVRRVVPL